MSKEVRKIIHALQRQGLEVTTARSGHYAVLRDGKRIMTMSKSPSDHHALKHIRGDLKRLGVEL
jgi:biotin operon repressor